MASESPNLGAQCQICGHMNADVIERHHKLPQRLGGPDDPENLVSLCGSCHNAIEEIYDDRFFSQLFDQVGYEVEQTDAGELGRTIDPKQSPDREFPPEPVHVTVESVDPDDLNEYEAAGAFEWEELEERGCLKRMPYDEWTEYLKELDREKHGKVTERTEEKIEDSDPDTPKFEFYTGFELIHCGYCNRVFAEWETADAARHLRIVHGIENPYRRKSQDNSIAGEGTREDRLLRAAFGGDRNVDE